MKIYVGSLAYTASEEEIRELFEQYGKVDNVHIPLGKETGKPRGFCYVEMMDDDGNAAIKALHRFEFKERNIMVKEALQPGRKVERPKDSKPPRRIEGRFGERGYEGRGESRRIEGRFGERGHEGREESRRSGGKFGEGRYER
jgi:RNA recognition motif-containing protein